jgi:hypothetical protein
MTFVENAKQAWKWFSVQAMVWAAAIQSAWELAPSDMKSNFTPTQVYMVTVTLLVLGIIGRLVKQGKDETKS